MNTGAARRVLVIDDNPINLKITAALTRKAGVLVDTVDSAEDGLAWINGSLPDLIVTDLHLTGMDGLDFTRTIKRNPLWRSIPVILLTADNSIELEVKAQSSGCVCMICKPVDATLFPGVIAGFVGASATATQASLVGDLPIEELRQEFLSSGASECRSLLSDFTASRLFVPELDLVSIRGALHRWAGVGGTLGFSEITRRARSVEDLAEAADPIRREDLRESLFDLLHEFTHAVPVERPATAARKEQPPSGVRVATSAAKPNILVVDDDATIRAVIKLSVEAAGFDCRLADHGVLACAMALHSPPSVIILDVNMPRMDGFQVLYTLRNQWSTRRVPVILLSARKAESDIRLAAQLGAIDYLTKPFDVNDLLSRLARVVGPSGQ